MQETGIQSLGQEHPLEKGMTIHSSILVWRIPWREESGCLQSWGLKELDMTEQLTLSPLSKAETSSELKKNILHKYRKQDIKHE